MSAVNDTLTWTCEACSGPITDGEGGLWVNTADADRYRRYTVNGVADSVADLLNRPDPAFWHVLHAACEPGATTFDDPMLTGVVMQVYRVDVASLRSQSDVVWMAGHLLGKGWTQYTDLGECLMRWARL